MKIKEIKKLKKKFAKMLALFAIALVVSGSLAQGKFAMNKYQSSFFR